MPNLLEAILGVAFIGAVALPLRATWVRSPVLMWAGALCSMVMSVAGMYSVGAFLFLFTCLELGAAVALLWQADGRGWATCLLAAALLWVAIVPVQIAGAVWLPWLAAFPVAFATSSVAMLLASRNVSPRGPRKYQ